MAANPSGASGRGRSSSAASDRPARGALAFPDDSGSGQLNELRKIIHSDGQGGLAKPRQPVVAVDAMGGDNAPEAIVTGAVQAFRQWGTRIVLIGRPGLVRPLLAEHGVVGEIRLVTAEDAIAMDDGALGSWRRPRSSLAIACQLVHLGQATAVMSAGSTGAIVALARLRLRNLPGVLRPGLAVALPTRPTPTVLIDAGATADPKPEMLAQFAQLGCAYAEVAFGIAKPRVGLLSIGAEPGKGNKLTKRAYELLTAEPQHGAMPIRFAGNIEGGDLLNGRVDVVVTEGFAGNVALKTLEGTAAFTAQQFKSALGGSRSARLGAALARKELRELADRLNSDTYGGAALLGLEGAVVIAHGASTARGAAAACRLAGDITSKKIAERIAERLGPGRQRHFLPRSDRHRSSTEPERH
ncbi:MAG TPA: phosphate acyltransferase PlsX [Streptosporangiaceae bacterium]|nr:phosphate acyltransferase PlsX [Streptosporangiaceae bacterium]